jgi:uncharacterized protein YoxC
MEAHTLITASFFIMVIALVAGLGFLIYCIIQIRKMAVTVSDFCRETDAKLTPLLEETEMTLRSVRVITDDVGAITGNVREVTDAVSDVACHIRAVSALIGGARDQASLRANGIKAGIQAALGLLLKNVGDRR